MGAVCAPAGMVQAFEETVQVCRHVDQGSRVAQPRHESARQVCGGDGS